MAKRKSKQKLFITAGEWANDFGGKKDGEKRSNEKPLPYYCCSLSLQPFDDPMCTLDGNLYEMLNIIPFLKKYKRDPVTGKPMTFKDLFKANFAVNSDDEYHCPILKKVFTDYSHIVIIRTTGNNPADKEYTQQKSLSNFHFIKEGLDFKEDQTTSNINLSETALRIFNELKAKGIPINSNDSTSTTTTTSTSTTSSSKLTTSNLNAESSKTSILDKDVEQYRREKREKEEAVRKQSGQAPSFTSTGMSLTSVIEDHPADRPGKKTKKKGYVSIQTNIGDINIQLHCDFVPKTCENFLALCATGYYNNVIFHRSIKNFMIQGGDPTGTGTGGQSIWKRAFADEFKPYLSHHERGILSMANSGPNTNGSQFFILFRPAPHLDRKHTVFGKVVGGLDVLKTMEMIKTNQNDVPLIPIKILGVKIFENPFETIDEEELEELKKAELKRREKESKFNDTERGQWYSNPNVVVPQTNKTGVGKYIVDTKPVAKVSAKVAVKPIATTTSTTTTPEQESQLKRQIIQDKLNETTKKSKTYGNFSNF
ncbi:cyclophilin-type peptidylprolyl cis-trans isomerase [Heterostelium album PN500]|uniref:Cyclophilin-type peptidylprolyl cis-trans isomerase n=1 Tax=Heterostelium pallidum (strain ATCC 26659 / Pp 5 / PN500) TaxID=670386 RepID=D3B4Z7_HETP5|nr:cyclophilin-type peptidylprolyl cis-trans isomerase [Heterostelium album PN500]EFA84395.1 cyclophilin-type peptidylprolyl cis-trans isomerase [Heterostelium album PN500]|eukprot:XP_020436509.1 cyclophilin-type peptidylprolyl cis-trans isomerase [Heterostelium album PN500]